MATVLSYNTHCVPYLTSTHHVDRICNYIGLLSTKYAPTIITLSEVFQPWVRNRFLQQLNQLEGTWKASPTIYPANVTVSSGLLILWNTVKIGRYGTMHSILYSRCCQLDCFSNKGAIHIPFKTVGDDSRVVNVVHTHMQAWEPTVLCSQVRKSQFTQLANMLGTVPQENLLVTGDFNENPNKDFASTNALVVVPSTDNAVLHTFDQNYYDHAYTNSRAISTIEVANIENNFGPSDHRAVVIKMFA